MGSPVGGENKERQIGAIQTHQDHFTHRLFVCLLHVSANRGNFT